MGYRSSGLSAIAAWMWSTARDGSWNLATPASAASRSTRPIPARRSASATLVPQLQRALVVGDGLREREARLGRDRRRDRRLERARQVMGRVPVIGDLGGMGGVTVPARLQGLREGRVKARPLARQQVVVDHLLEQRVAERVALDAGVRVGHEDLPRHRLAERKVDGLLVQAAGHRQERWVDPLTRRGGHAQELLGGVAQVRDSGEQHVAQRRGQGGPAVAVGRGEQLLRVERVATGPLVDRLDQRRVDVRPRDRPELRGGARAVQRQDLDPVRATRSLELRKERQERVAPVELVRAIGHHEEHGRVAEIPHEKRQQVASRPVGPVEVLHDEQHGCASGEPLEDAQQELEQAALAGREREAEGGVDGVGAEAGHEARQLGTGGTQDVLQLVGRQGSRERAQRLGQWRIRQGSVAQDQAPAYEHGGAAGLRDRHELRQQPCLAHAGLARDEGRAAAPLQGGRQRGLQAAELVGPADEDGA